MDEPDGLEVRQSESLPSRASKLGPKLAVVDNLPRRQPGCDIPLLRKVSLICLLGYSKHQKHTLPARNVNKHFTCYSVAGP